MQRLGKNIKGYSGETIDIQAVQRDCVTAAQAHDWTIEEIHPAPTQIFAFTRSALHLSRSTALAGKGARAEGLQPLNVVSPERCMPFPLSPSGGERVGVRGPIRGSGTLQAPRVYISTGIHGDEPAGPLAARQLLQQNAWPPNWDLYLCPCLNPSGFALNRRENRDGLDLNRQYLVPVTAETVAHIAWLKRQPPFDLCLCLHEDWEAHGFYLYEQNPGRFPSLAEDMVARVSELCPIDRSEIIEGRPARNGIIRPNLDPRSRPQWPEAFFLITHKTQLSYTLEAPSDFPLAVRVAALVAAVNAALETHRPEMQARAVDH